MHGYAKLAFVEFSALFAAATVLPVQMREPAKAAIRSVTHEAPSRMSFGGDGETVGAWIAVESPISDSREEHAARREIAFGGALETAWLAAGSSAGGNE
jgi:hypothetical protein